MTHAHQFSTAPSLRPNHWHMRRATRTSTALVGLGMAAVMVLAGVETVRAQALDWDPGQTGGVTLGGTGDWDEAGGGNTTNWWDGASNIAFTNGDDVSFAGTAGTVTITDPSVAPNDVTFGVSGYTITGNDIDATNGVLIDVQTFDATIASDFSGTGNVDVTGTGTLTLDDVALNNTGNFTTASGSTLVIDTGLAVGATTTVDIAGNLTNNGTTTVDYALANVQTLTNTGDLTVDGVTVATTDLDNTGTGSLTIDAGTVSASNSAQNQAGGAIDITDGGTLDLALAAFTNDGDIAISGTGGTLQNTGDITNANQITTTGTGTSTVSSGGTITNTGSMDFQGSGTANLQSGSGIINTGGAIALTNGDLTVTGNITGGTVTVNSSGGTFNGDDLSIQGAGSMLDVLRHSRPSRTPPAAMESTWRRAQR